MVECSGIQDSKELLRSPQSGQAKGEKSGQRLSHSFRLGELSLENIHAASDAISRLPSLFLSFSLHFCLPYVLLMIYLFLFG